MKVSTKNKILHIILNLIKYTVKETAQILRDSSTNVTLNIYTHVLEESALKFKSVLDNLYIAS